MLERADESAEREHSELTAAHRVRASGRLVDGREKRIPARIAVKEIATIVQAFSNGGPDDI